MNTEHDIEVTYIVEPFMYEDAKAFYHSAKQLKPAGTRLDKPYVVLLSLSIELLLKSLGVRQQFVVTEAGPEFSKSKIKHTTGHGLDDIFNSLRHKHPQLGKLLMSSYAKRTQHNLVDDLQKNSRVFEQVRYTYPKNGSALNHGHVVDVEALESVSDFLVDIGEELIMFQARGGGLSKES